ncbi:MAG: tRNA uracil 4-sulfurtransferase ThiI [Nitrospirota bacterium]|jgi:thiamine biosynthesis protein ThiI
MPTPASSTESIPGAPGVATPCVLVHYSEIGLKGRNRPLFERQLAANIRRAFGEGTPVEVRRLFGRYLVEVPDETPPLLVEERLTRVFGVAYFAHALAVSPTLEAIETAAAQVVAGREFATFAVRAKRADKSFPVDSQGINVAVGAHLRRVTERRVDLTHPDLTVHVEVVDRRALVYADRVEGPRGLPVGIGGRVVCLLSGGIDSPVAAARMMRRGCRVGFVHFHSFPYTDPASQQKAVELAGILGRFQGPAHLYLVPLVDIQRHIVAGAPSTLRVVLYRRAMLRLAAAIARREKALALVTGESLGQVASQTLANLTAVDRASPLPVLRPLLGWDKEEIIAEAQRIATFDLSIEPHDDCCSFLEPKDPATRSTDHKLAAVERSLALDDLLAAALAAAELRLIEPSP